MVQGYINTKLKPCSAGDVNFDEMNKKVVCDKDVMKSSRSLVRQSSTGVADAAADEDLATDAEEIAAKKKKEIQSSLGALGMMSDFVSIRRPYSQSHSC